MSRSDWAAITRQCQRTPRSSTTKVYSRGRCSSEANAPTTVERFPYREAVRYRQIALEYDVPGEAILVESEVWHTGENIDLTRKLLDRERIIEFHPLPLSSPLP